MKKLILLLGILLITSPAYAESLRFDINELPSQEMLVSTESTPFNDTRGWLIPTTPYDTTEKILFGYMVGLQVADVVTTVIALDRGAEEVNWFFGKHPSTGTIIVSKLAFVGIAYVAINYIDDRTIRKVTLGTIDILMTGVIINNISVINDL